MKRAAEKVQVEGLVCENVAQDYSRYIYYALQADESQEDPKEHTQRESRLETDLVGARVEYAYGGI